MAAYIVSQRLIEPFTQTGKSEICFSVVFGTGVLYDYSVLYGFMFSTLGRNV